MLLPDGRSILHMASAEGNYKMVEMLLEQVVPTVVLACGTTLHTTTTTTTRANRSTDASAWYY
eukprot:1484488-Rhodomonas_salina.3